MSHFEQNDPSPEFPVSESLLRFESPFPGSYPAGRGQIAQVHRSGTYREMDMGILAKLIDQKISLRVVCSHAPSTQLETVFEFGQVEGRVEKASASTHRFGCDVGNGAFGGIKVDELDELPNPVPAARNPLSWLSCRHPILA